MDKGFWAIHAHSRYSLMDGMGPVGAHVERAAQLGYPALALTDHGTMAGVAELYTACRRAGIKPLPGIEAYASYGTRTRKTFHVGLVAVSELGYRNLVAINNRMQADFYYKPILDLTAIDQMDTRDVILTTGCFFGVAFSAHRADPGAAMNVIATLADHFDVYVEAQSHGIISDDHDDITDQMTALHWARTLGLPMVLGADCHYVHADDRANHDVMKRLGSWSDDPDSAVFPGEYGYHMPSTDEARLWYEPAVYRAGIAGLAEIAERADVVIPPLDSFSPVLLTHPSDSDRIRRVYDSPLIPEDRRADYVARIDDELEVIEGFGFTGYMLLCADLAEHMTSERITYSVRGSALGCLTAYLLGIHRIDPMRWGLGFERFLSRNRAKLPDIDFDVDSSRRDDVIAHLRRTYEVTGICNYLELKVRGDQGAFKGSAIVKWKTAQRKSGKSQVPDEKVFDSLERVCNGGAVMSTRGTHASGLVIAPDSESMRWMPLSVVGSASSADRMLTALDMDSTEAMGYVKIDILGLAVLHAVDVCLRRTRITLDDIPFDDAEVYAIMGEGLTDGVFQLEGWTTRNGVRRLKPENIHDVIAAMALFRPAAMDSGATDRYLDRRRRRRKGLPSRDTTKAFHPDIADVIAPTMGELLYQDQVIDILRNLGMDGPSLSNALKALKASNSKVEAARVAIENLRSQISDLAKGRGWSKVDVTYMDVAFDAYANYGFNKAHATGYGVLAYQTAWLMYHHPGDFWQGMIEAHGNNDDKVAEYTEALSRRRFVRVPVDVNTSKDHISVDVENRRIYPSLTTIKGVGAESAAKITAAAPFDDITDFATRLATSGITGIGDLNRGIHSSQCTGVVGVLHRAGALRSLQ